MNDFARIVQECGVIGAGGAGFPAYGKLTPTDTVIANGAECEPLLYKDRMLLEHHADGVVEGLEIMRRETGAKRAAIAVKAKNSAALETVQQAAKGRNIELIPLENVYPAGDEVDLVYHVTGKQIPAGGIPIEIGVVVNNVETLANLAAAQSGRPVTKKLISVTGGVANPRTFWLPVGTSYQDAIRFCGGSTVDVPAVVDGGPMMGVVAHDLSGPITKTCGGLIILPADHILIRRKTETEVQYKRIGKSACDQCSLCTELCPRYLLGYPVKPHLVMRALQFSGPQSVDLSRWAQLCCECNICTLYACPENLNPKDMCRSAKHEIGKAGNAWSRAQAGDLVENVHPMREYRQVPVNRLKRMLGLDAWDKIAGYTDDELDPAEVRIPLKQHIGAPATAAVAVGDAVFEGDVIGRVATGELGAWVHASIDGTVTDVGSAVTIRRD